MGTESQFCKMKEFWGQTVMMTAQKVQINLMALSHALKNVKMVNLCYAYFTTIKNNTTTNRPFSHLVVAICV